MPYLYKDKDYKGKTSNKCIYLVQLRVKKRQIG